MKYLSGYYTDVGTQKKTNQDSMLLMHADTAYGEAVFAVVCDGMGGLQKGELASSESAAAMREWFVQGFPLLIQGGVLDTEGLHRDWLNIMRTQDARISRYGAEYGLSLGTTLVCLLLFRDQYYVANIGDSRAYLLSDQTYQITHDHTVVQRKLDSGLITPEQAITDPQRSVLLQCIGTSDYVEPDFFTGAVQNGHGYLLCCDGFRHVVAPTEFYSALQSKNFKEERTVNAALKQLAELNMSRGETDNISAIYIRSRK